MTATIRGGIVGATVIQGGSGWGASAHVPALTAPPQYELSSACGCPVTGELMPSLRLCGERILFLED